MALLPMDIWLLVFDIIDIDWPQRWHGIRFDHFLWYNVRNTSHFLRDCVDQYISRRLSRNWLVDLLYSDMHMHEGPLTYDIHLPMVFDRFSSDGTRMYFEQRAFRDRKEPYRQGSLRGWVPFIERYCEETRKPAPAVLHASKPAEGPPLWEQMHAHWRNTLTTDQKRGYLMHIRHAIAIGRGDHPPYYLNIMGFVNDTEVVDLVVDCKQREISFDWRKTFAAFLREIDYEFRAEKSSRKQRVWDADLAACDARSATLQHRKNGSVALHARRKRLQPWAVKNKHRMSPEMRWTTECAVLQDFKLVERILSANKLCEMIETGDESPEEIVPTKLASDHRDLLDWPWSDDNRYFASRNTAYGAKKCVIL